MKTVRSAMLAPLLLAGLTGCESTTTPTAMRPVAEANVVATTHVLLGGQPSEGRTLSGENGRTMFEIELRDRHADALALVQMCGIDFDLPRRGMGPRRSGTQLCYDDGTHGDDVPFDGVFHYLDDRDTIGCGGATMMTGSYDYRLWCSFHDGTFSEQRLQVTRR